MILLLKRFHLILLLIVVSYESGPSIEVLLDLALEDEEIAQQAADVLNTSFLCKRTNRLAVAFNNGSRLLSYRKLCES